MAGKAFDRKFGEAFVASVPATPGVYRIFDDAGALIYVGKAKNLRRRLSQYRNAKRRKKHLKMREIIGEAARIEFELCATDLDACLLEERLIRELRPRWNVAGAFSFLYPMIGLKREGENWFFVYTTTPSFFLGLEWHGAYRSRETAGEAFFALARLLKFVGHSETPKKACTLLLGRGILKPKHSYVFAFRKLPEASLETWRAFFRGKDIGALEALALDLLENAGARKAAAEVQADLRAVKRFWRTEALRLDRAIRRTAHPTYPVPQADRDSLFLRYKYSYVELTP